MNYYHVRVNLISGTALDGYACLGLSQAVATLDKLTGKKWPYQVIHRTVKAGRCWAQAYEQPAVTLPAGAAHVGRCVVVSVEDAGQQPYPEMRHPNEAQPLCLTCDAPRSRASEGWHSCFTCGPGSLPSAPSPATEKLVTLPLAMLADYAAIIVSWVPDIIEKGVPAKDAPVFRRLEKSLVAQLGKLGYEPLRRK